MSVTTDAKLMVTGISPHWRSEYRRFRRAGFTPNDATLVIYGGIHHSRQMKLTLERMLAGETDLRVQQ